MFNPNTRVIHDNGKYGTVAYCYWDWGVEYVPVRFDDGTYETVHRSLLTELPDHWQKLTERS